MGFVDNDKNGNLAFTMAAAATVTSDSEKYVYAGVLDAAALTTFYTTFNEGGSTHSPDMIWSGDLLMDLKRYQALKITTKEIAGTNYLFIESGGFSNQNPVGWKSPWIVMKRKAAK